MNDDNKKYLRTNEESFYVVIKAKINCIPHAMSPYSSPQSFIEASKAKTVF